MSEPTQIGLTINSSHPDIQVRAGDIETYYTARGLPRYSLEIWHDGLNKYQVIKGESPYVIKQKAEAKLNQWQDQWARRKAKEDKKAAIGDAKDLADERTEEAQDALSELESVLERTLDVDDTVDWESLKIRSDYGVAKPIKPASPQKPQPHRLPQEPQRSDPRYQPVIGILDRLWPARRRAKEEDAGKRYKHDHDVWLKKKQARDEAHAANLRSYEAEVGRLDAEYQNELTEWERKRDEFIAERDEANNAIDEQTARYERKEPEAIVEYCDLVLSNSSYPDYFPQEYRLDFVSETGILIADYQLPPKESLPTLKEVRYIQSRDEFKEKHITDSQLNGLYDSLLYQIALRTIHELFEADSVDALKAVVFNGYVNSIDPATGIEGNPCILSVQAAKDEFMAMNLSRIDPKACFKKLKGVSSSKLHTLTQVKPLKQILSREDDRFTDSYDVIDGLEGTNLAAMDWKEFEHFVREIFEKIFSDAGGEVKVTQASRDGGVDAIAFDPDPIRGGKIVIQAKRYVNTVGVTAVRDLWGTVNHEGAMKGILVTTSDFGPDAYAFASDKPLQLIGGGELLHLLEQHGHKARIDLAEARKLASER